MSQLLDRHGPYVAPLILGRLTDTVTTLYGLSMDGVYERNPLVADLIATVGTGGGLFVANVLTIAGILLVVEVGLLAIPSDRIGIGEAVTERFVLDAAYLPAVAVSFGAAIFNLGVIATA